MEKREDGIPGMRVCCSLHGTPRWVMDAGCWVPGPGQGSPWEKKGAPSPFQECALPLPLPRVGQEPLGLPF